MGFLNMALGGALGGQGGSMAGGLLPMLLQQQGGGQPPLAPPQMPPQPSSGNALQGAFNGNPQFQQQLGGIMQGQGPGHQAPVFTPPSMPMSEAPPVRPGQATRGGPFFGQGLQRPW